jgi:predicted permease
MLRDDRRQSTVGRGTLRLRKALVVVQVAGSLILIVAAGLLTRSLLAMQQSDPGVDVNRLAFLRTSVAPAGLSGAEGAALLEQVRLRIASLPGVTHAALASRLPAQNLGTTTTLVEGYQPQVGTDAVEMSFAIVSANYFETAGLRLLEGRWFAPTDVPGAERVVLVNASTARRFWGDGPAVGRRLRSQSQPALSRTVIGVVEDAPVHAYPERDAPPMFYATDTQATLGTAYIVARTSGSASALLPSMRLALADVRESLPVMSQGTLASHLGEALARPRFIARLMSGVSLLALVLAALGIYAVVAFSVARRRGELGIRIALGAAPGRVIWMVLRETAGAVLLGMAAAIAVSAALVGRLESLLFGVQPLDPVTFGGAVGFLGAVAALAAYLPARRAARTDPAVTLRA